MYRNYNDIYIYICCNYVSILKVVPPPVMYPLPEETIRIIYEYNKIFKYQNQNTFWEVILVLEVEVGNIRIRTW